MTKTQEREEKSWRKFREEALIEIRRMNRLIQTLKITTEKEPVQLTCYAFVNSTSFTIPIKSVRRHRA